MAFRAQAHSVADGERNNLDTQGLSAVDVSGGRDRPYATGSNVASADDGAPLDEPQEWDDGARSDFDDNDLGMLDDADAVTVFSADEIGREADLKEAAAALRRERARGARQYPFEWSEFLRNWERFRDEAVNGRVLPLAQKTIAEASPDRRVSAAAVPGLKG